MADPRLGPTNQKIGILKSIQTMLKNIQACICEMSIEVNPPTGATTTPTVSNETGAGSTTASLQAVYIANTGAAAGTVAGATFPIGAILNLEAYLDPVANTYNRLTAIAYDATGTNFLIVETP